MPRLLRMVLIGSLVPGELEGSFALLFFFSEGTPVAAVSAEVYRLISSPTLPAIPLLTACGYVLAESGASSRLRDLNEGAASASSMARKRSARSGWP